MSNQRRVKNIIELFAYSDQLVFQETLMKRFEISKRTLQNDIALINRLLTNAGFDRISYASTTGYAVQNEQRKFLLDYEKLSNEQKDYYPIEERLLRILFLVMFSTEKIVSASIAEYNLVTKNTTINDIKQLRTEMKEFNIDLHYNSEKGNFFVGEEHNIRNYFLKMLFEGFSAKMSKTIILMSNSLPNTTFDNETLQSNKDHFLSIENRLNIHYTDDMLEKLSIVLFLMTYRINSYHYVSKTEGENNMYHNLVYYEESKQLINSQSFSAESAILDNESRYLEKFLICGNKTRENNELNVDISQAITKMIQSYEKYSRESFGSDSEQLFNDLLAHLSPAFYRIVFNLEWINPSVIDIRNKYKKEYEYTRKSVKSFEEIVNKEVPENEIMYLTIIFGGYSYRKKHLINNTIIVICPHGITRSKLIENQLRSFLPANTTIQQSLSVREFQEEGVEADIVVSTVPLKEVTNNFILVEKEISEDQKMSILSLLNINEMDIEDSTGPLALSDIILRDSIVYTKDNLTWMEAIRMASQPLVDKEIINGNYVNAMIDSVNTWGPYIIIAPGIAFPHALPKDGAFGVGCSILFSEKSIPFSDDAKHDVRIIVVITSSDGFSHIKSLSELTYLLTFHHLSDKMSEAQSAEDVFNIIKSHLSD